MREHSSNKTPHLKEFEIGFKKDDGRRRFMKFFIQVQCIMDIVQILISWKEVIVLQGKINSFILCILSILSLFKPIISNRGF